MIYVMISQSSIINQETNKFKYAVLYSRHISTVKRRKNALFKSFIDTHFERKELDPLSQTIGVLNHLTRLKALVGPVYITN